MNLSKQFILLNGEPKTLQINNIEKNGADGYSVHFKNNAKSYNYGYDKVTWLTDPEWFDPTHCQVFINNIQQQNIREIWKFTCGTKCYWRIVHTNGYTQDGDNGKINVQISCLDDKTSEDTFSYLKNVAIINPLGKDKDSNGILADLYGKIDFVNEHFCSLLSQP